MRCPYCHAMEDRVVDSRTGQEGRAVRRRRECLSCTRRFTTYEYVEERPIQVLKRDGSTQEFYDQKIIENGRITQVAGSRTYCLKGRLALLEQALMLWAQKQLAASGFTLMTVPALARPQVRSA